MFPLTPPPDDSISYSRLPPPPPPQAREFKNSVGVTGLIVTKVHITLSHYVAEPFLRGGGGGKELGGRDWPHCYPVAGYVISLHRSPHWSGMGAFILLLMSPSPSHNAAAACLSVVIQLSARLSSKRPHIPPPPPFSQLDGTARGGCVVSVVDELSIPVKFIGVGEALEDLMPFVAEEFVDSIMPTSPA